MKKISIVELLIARQLVRDHDEARRLVMAGQVIGDNHRIDKPGTRVRDDTQIRIKGQRSFASRAGSKLAHALILWDIDVHQKIALDIGASTGGFTDCLIKNGAQRVYAVDVGRGLLQNALLRDPRVVDLSGTHACDLNGDLVPEALDLIVADVAFTSLRQVLPPALDLLKPNGQLVLLFKPQFEVARHEVEVGGVVSNQEVRQRSLQSFVDWLKEHKAQIMGVCDSPVQGRKRHNIEILIWAQMGH